MILHVLEATYKHDHVIHLKFNDGAEGVVDLSNQLYGEMFAPLKDIEKFKAFRLDPELNTIAWENGADLAPEFLPNDELPETLEPILRYFFADCGPEVMGMIANYNAWVEAHPDLPSGAVIQGDEDPPTAHPSVGWFDFALRGVRIRKRDCVDAVYHFQRVLDVVAGLDAAGRERVDQIVNRTGGRELLAARPARRLKSENYRFVLG